MDDVIYGWPLLSIICTFYMKLGENFIRSQVPESTITLPLFFFFNLPKAHFDVNCKNGIFLEPLQWMSPCQSVSENKLHCAKCGSKLGSFAWDTPIKCACGASMAPGFHINLSRVDKCTMHKEIEAVI